MIGHKLSNKTNTNYQIKRKVLNVAELKHFPQLNEPRGGEMET
jgi:hypothetical protein